MADTITFRPDDDTSNALAVLTRDGTPVSAAVRTALIDAARRKVAASIRARLRNLQRMKRSGGSSAVLRTWRRCVRGEIFRLRAPRGSRGHEQSGTRYAVVIQSETSIVNLVGSTTSTAARVASFVRRSILPAVRPECWLSKRQPSTRAD